MHRAAISSVVAAVLVAVLVTAPAGAFQFEEFKGHSVTDFPRVRHLLDKAKRLLRGDEAPAEAFDALQEVIDRFPNQVYRERGGIYRGARAYAIEMLASLPPEAREAYREAVDPIAAPLFERAVTERSIEGLLEVAHRFLFTSFGPPALERLGRLLQERGEWEEAAYYFRRSIDPRLGVAAKPEILARLADCLHRAGWTEALAALDDEIERAGPEAEVRVAGEARTLSEHYRELLAADAEPEPAWNETWAQYGGGTASRASAYEGGLARPITVPIESEALDPHSFDHTQQLMRQYLPGLDELIAPFHPVVHGSVAFLHDGIRLDAVNLITGDRKWSLPASAEEPVAFPHPRMIYTSAFADGVVYAALETPVRTRGLSYRLTPIKLAMPRRVLTAVDAATGKRVWAHDDPGEEDPAARAFLSRASVCTPPLLWRERLFVGMSYFEGKIHSYVCCFDRRTGRLRWRTLVCTGQQELNMFGNQFMEYVASPLGLSGDTLAFVTNLGLVASLDARSGGIRWINDYPIIPLPHPQTFQPRTRRLSWYANPPFTHDGNLMVTPLDCDDLLAFDRDSGELLFSHPRRSRRTGLADWDSRFALGMADGRLILAGDEVLAFEVGDRRIAWVHEFDRPDEEAAGVGFLAENRLYCPTQYSLYSIDPRTGKRLDDPTRWERGPAEAGNVLAFEDLFLTASTTDLSIYFRWDEISRKLKEKLTDHPGAVEIHLKLGDGYAHTGDLSAALEHYRAALALARERRGATALALRARKGLHHVHTTLGLRAFEQGDVELAISLFRDALEHAFDDASRVRAYRNFENIYRDTRDSAALRRHYESMLREIPGLRQQFNPREESIPAGLYALVKLAELDIDERRPDEAIERFQRVLREFPRERYAGTSSAQHAKEQIDFLIRTFGRQVYASIEGEASALFERAAQSRSTDDFERLLLYYPNSEVIPDALLSFSRVLQGRGEDARALGILREFLRKFPRSPLRTRVLDQTVESYRSLGHVRAAAYVRALRDGKPPRAVPPGGARPREEVLDAPVEEIWRKPFAREGSLEFVSVEGHPLPDFFRRHVILNEEASVYAFDVDRAEIVWTQEDVRLTNRSTMYFQDERLFFSTVDDEVMCLDPITGNEHWVREFDERVLDVVVAPGTIVVAHRGNDKSSFVLEGLDAATGQVAWTRHVSGQILRMMYESAGYVVVRSTSRAQPGRVIVFESYTGSQTAEFPAEPQFPPVPFEGGRLLVAAGRQALSMHDLRDGKRIWSHPRPKSYLRLFNRYGDSVVAMFDDRLVVLGAADGSVRFDLRVEEGNKIDWIPGMEEQVPDTLYLRLHRSEGKPENALLALDGGTGEVRFEYPLPDNPIFVKRLLRAGSSLIIQITQYRPDARVQVVLLDAEKGEQVQTLSFEDNYFAEVKVLEGRLGIIAGNRMHLLGRNPK